VAGLGIIAGTGMLPLDVAEEAVRNGHHVVAIAFSGLTDAGIERRARDTVWLKLGQLDKAIAALKSRGIDRVVLVGKIDKSHLMRPWNVRPDRRTLRIIRSLVDRRDDTILGAISAEFAQDGIVVDDITRWAGRLMAPLGVVGKATPSDRQWNDIAFGRTMALGIGGLDIGQTVAVKNSAVIVVEAIEGTDRAIRRIGDLGFRHAVVVKMAKPNQDMRFDVPGVGPTTIESLIAVNAKVLAMEAHKTIMAESGAMMDKANRAGIAVVGISATGPLVRERI
jgi:UDP-2,3-diacylglucosamine hydrolase